MQIIKTKRYITLNYSIAIQRASPTVAANPVAFHSYRELCRRVSGISVIKRFKTVYFKLAFCRPSHATRENISREQYLILFMSAPIAEYVDLLHQTRIPSDARGLLQPFAHLIAGKSN